MQVADRWLESALDGLLAAFRVVILHGARQVGKSTLAHSLHRRVGGHFVDLDDPLALDSASADPVGSLAGVRRPVLVDEFQRAGLPLLLAVKAAVDRDPSPGQFLLTGSANHLAARHHTETLAGRNVRVVLWPFSQGELAGDRERFLALALSDPAHLLDLTARPESRAELAERVCAGGFPEVALGRIPRARRWQWFASYGSDCTEREALRGIADVRRTDALRHTLSLLAVRTGTELVFQSLRADLGGRGEAIDHKTLVSFADLLEALHLVHRLPAWSTNQTTRARKHPKVHLTDSGLAAGLARIEPARLAEGAPFERLAGQLVETFVVNELAKQASWLDQPVLLGHHRSQDHEADVIVERSDGCFVAIETKFGPVQPRDSRHLAWLRDTHPDRFLAGIILHGGDRLAPLGDRLYALPIPALWA